MTARSDSRKTRGPRACFETPVASACFAENAHHFNIFTLWLPGCSRRIGRLKTRAKHARGIYFNRRGDMPWGRREETEHPGFGSHARLEAIEKNGFVLTPGRYVGAADQDENDEPFDQKMKRLTSLLKHQQEEGAKLDQKIAENLRRLGYEF